MKATNLIIASLVFLFISCSAKRELSMHTFFQSKKYTYKLTVPFKFTLFEKKNRNAEGNELLKEARVNDGSVVYITNDVKNGGNIDDLKVEKYGRDFFFNHYLFNDTATLFGLRDGRYWKEMKYYNIVVGYYNVPAEKRMKYDEIINTIIPQVDKARGFARIEQPNLLHEVNGHSQP